MTKLDEIGTWLRDRLPDLLAESQVPGAVVAIGHGERTVDVAAGVLNTATGVEATADSIFQIGSITKVLTATLAMQLVDEGELDLDAPVRRYLPEFRIADERAAARITVRHLLCHVAGFEGDIFTDTGKGDDCVEKYVDVLREVPQLFEPGEMFSYNNAGFCVLGRIIEVV
ncbi:serine hydrolase domain-containing protein, partial [Nonomuraea sp. NPDC055795]